MGVIKKVAIFGGSGMTGLCVVKAALDQGLTVRLLLRPSSVLPSEYENKVEIVRGDVTDAKAVNDTVCGTDGVVVVLGTRNNVEPTTVMSTGVKNVLLAMEKNCVKPVTVCLSSFLFMPPQAVPPVFKHINEEHGRMLSALEENQLDWVAVMPPHIAQQPKSGFLIKEGALPGGRVVSKFDLGEFLVQALSTPEYYRKKVGISSVAP